MHRKPDAPLQKPQSQTTANQLQQASSELLSSGIRLHQNGRFVEAEKLYLKILKIDSRNFEALHLLGLIAAQNRNPKAAANLISLALEINPDNADAHCNKGNALLELRQFNEAVTSFDQATKLNKNNAIAYNNKGVALLELNHLEEAAVSLTQAVTIKPDYADAYNNLGNAQKALGRLDAAIASYDRAIEISPENPIAFTNRGNALKELNRLDEAVESHRRAVRLRSDYADAHYNLGNALQELRQFEEAIASYRNAIKINPHNSETHFNLGNCFQELGRSKEALASYRRAIEIHPGNPLAYSNLGQLLDKLNQSEKAISSYQRAIQIKPDLPEAHFLLGNALQKLNRFDQALRCYQRAIEIRLGYAEAHNNLGIALHKLMRLEEAVSSYDRAIALKHDYAEAYNNRGKALHSLKQFDGALASYDRAIEIKPDYSMAHLNKYLLLLLQGQFSQGWELYEWRWKETQTGPAPRHFTQRLWLGTEDIKGKTILLHAEQGLGDCIQFSRYTKLIKDRGARLIIEAPKPLVGILKGLEGADVIVQAGSKIPPFEFHCPLMSLPLAFKTNEQNIPGAERYISSDENKRKQWSIRLGEKTKPRIGLVWSGSATHSNDHNRSLPLQELIDKLPENLDYISLQKEVRETDKRALASSCVRDFGYFLSDFTETAALCDLMDVVVCVDTSVAHLAGALGKNTYLLIPHVPDWRWLLDKEYSPWYNSIRLYRQDESRTWTKALTRISEDLSALESEVHPKKLKDTP